MNIKYFKEEKVTKKSDTKEPLSVTQDGFLNDEGELKTYWDFFKSFEGSSISISVTTSNKTDLEEDESDSEDEDEDLFDEDFE